MPSSSSTIVTPEKLQVPSGKSSPTNNVAGSSSGGGGGSRRSSNSGGGGAGKLSPLVTAKPTTPGSAGGSAKGPSPAPSPKGSSPGPSPKGTSPGPGASKKPSRSGSPEALPTIIDFPILESTPQAGLAADVGEPGTEEEEAGNVDVEAIEKDALEDQDKGSDEVVEGNPPLVDDANDADDEGTGSGTQILDDEDRQSPPPVAGGGAEEAVTALESGSDAGTSKKVSGKISGKVSNKISGKVSDKIDETMNGESNNGDDDVVDIATAAAAAAGGGEVEVDQMVSEEEAEQIEQTDAATAAVAQSVSPPSSSQRDQGLGETPPNDTTNITEADHTSGQPTPNPGDDQTPSLTPPPVEGDVVATDKDLEREAKEAKIRAANEKRAAIEAAEEEARKALEEKVGSIP